MSAILDYILTTSMLIIKIKINKYLWISSDSFWTCRRDILVLNVVKYDNTKLTLPADLTHIPGGRYGDLGRDASRCA